MISICPKELIFEFHFTCFIPVSIVKIISKPSWTLTRPNVAQCFQYCEDLKFYKQGELKVNEVGKQKVDGRDREEAVTVH